MDISTLFKRAQNKEGGDSAAVEPPKDQNQKNVKRKRSVSKKNRKKKEKPSDGSMDEEMQLACALSESEKGKDLAGFEIETTRKYSLDNNVSLHFSN